MNRDELVEAGVQAVKDRYYGTVADETTEGLIRQDVAVTVDAVEPLIRADEREKRIPFEVLTVKLRAALERDLRAKVMALTPYEDGRISKGLVIAMIDGDVE